MISARLPTIISSPRELLLCTSDVSLWLHPTDSLPALLLAPISYLMMCYRQLPPSGPAVFEMLKIQALQGMP